MDLINGLFKTKAKFLILFLIFIIMIMLIILSFSQKQPALPQATPAPIVTAVSLPKNLPVPSFQPKENLSAKDVKFNFTFNNPQLPTEVRVYSVTSYAIRPTTAQSIANTFNFSSQPEVINDAVLGTKLFWQNQSATQELTISVDSGLISYSTYYSFLKPDTEGTLTQPIESIEQVIQAVNSFLQDNNLLRPDISTSTEQVAMFKSGGETPDKADSIESADLFRVDFNRTINGIPVYSQLGDSAPVSVWFNKQQHQIVDLQYRYPIIQSSNQASRLLTIDEAKTRIVQNQGVIVKYGENTDYSPTLTNLSSITLSDLKLAYLDDRSNKLLQPIFVFKGTALENSNSNPKEIVIYLPAMQ